MKSMKKIFFFLFALVAMAVNAQELRVATTQVGSSEVLGTLTNGDAIVLKCTDRRVPYHAFNPGNATKNEGVTLDNIMVLSSVSWDAENGLLSFKLKQKSSGAYLTQTIGTLTANADDAFTFTALMREPSGLDDTMEDFDPSLAVSLTDGAGNYLNTQGQDDATAVAWKPGTAAWSVWYMYKVDGVFAQVRDGGQYYIKTQATSYSKDYTDYYYTSKSEEDYNVYLSSTNNTQNEIWMATATDDAASFNLQNLATGLYLHTNPTTGNEYGRYQSRPEVGVITLMNPTELSAPLYNNDISLFMFWSNRTGGTKYSDFSSANGDRWLVYPYAKGDGDGLGEGMYYSSEQHDANYGLVYRLYDVETGLPAALPEIVISAFDLYQDYITNLSIPEYREGTEPGCVVNYELASQITDRLRQMREEIDWDEHDVEDSKYWNGLLNEAKGLVAQLEGLEFVPVTPGYYRFVSSFEQFYLKQDHEKAMGAVYAKTTSGTQVKVAAWYEIDYGTPEVITDPDTGEEKETGKITGLEQIWEITEGEDGRLYAKNLEQQTYFTNLDTQNAYAYLDTEKQWLEFNNTKLGDFTIKVAGKGYDMHCQGHSSGAGTSGYVIGWNGVSNSASSWYIRPITKQEIIDTWGEGVFDQAVIDADMKETIAKAEEIIAQSKSTDITYINEDSKIAVSADQLYSEGTEPSEGAIENLIDGDYSTFWHSAWSGGSLEFGSEEQMKHFVQFDLLKEYDKLALLYACRAVANDKPISFSVTASNDPEGEFVEVATVENVGTTNSTTYYYEVKLGAPYRYVRVRATDTNAGKRGYWHASELNFLWDYSASPDLFDKTGEVGTNLEAALETAKGIDTPTRSDVEALKAALQAFLDAYTDPTELYAAISSADKLVLYGGVGAAVGQKNDAKAFEALENSLKAAKGFVKDKLETCTKAEITAQTTELTGAIEAWNAVEPVKLTTGVWYYLQCPTGVFERISYDPVENNGYYEEGTSLRGARVAVGVANTQDADLGETVMHMTPKSFLDAQSVIISSEEVDYQYTDACAQWRFIEAGDGAYYIQNRATGLFLPTLTSKTPGQLKTSYVPGAYVPEYYNGGVVNLVGSFLNEEGEKVETCIHMQTANATVVGWATRGTAGLNNGSSWEIVKAEDVAKAPGINMAFEGRRLRGLTLPYAIDVDGAEMGSQVYFYTKVAGFDKANGAVCFDLATGVIEAGTPMFVFCADDDIARIPMSGEGFSWEVDNSGEIRGTLTNGTKAPAGAALPGVTDTDENYVGEVWGACATAADATAVAIGSAWLVGAKDMACDAADFDNTQVMILDTSKGELVDAIAVVKEANNKVSVIYNLNGQQVRANVKGLVIMNGKKVFIK